MRRLKQVSVAVENQPGELTSLCNRLKRKKVEILGMCAPEGTGVMQVKILVDDHMRAKEAFDKSGLTCYFEEVLALDLNSRSASLSSITGKLTERGVNITSLYFTTPAKSDKATAILSVSDLETAISALKK